MFLSHRRALDGCWMGWRVLGEHNATHLWENAETLTERLQISHIRTVNLSFAPSFGLGGDASFPPAKKTRCMLMCCRLTVLGFTVLAGCYTIHGTATAYVRIRR